LTHIKTAIKQTDAVDSLINFGIKL